MKHINRRKLLLVLFDIACFCIAGAIFLFLYTNGAPAYMTVAQRLLQLLLIVFCVFCGRLAFRCYANIWRYARASEYFRMILADFCGGLWFLVLRIFVPEQIEFLRAVVIVTLGCLSCLAARFVYQLLQGRLWQRDNETESAVENVNVAIIGAGRLGATLAKELSEGRGVVYSAAENKRRRYTPVCFIDNNPQKIGSYLEGLKVLPEGMNGVKAAIEKRHISEFIIALPDMSPAAKQKIYEQYAETGLKVKIYDYPFADAESALEDTRETNVNTQRSVREFKIEELLFRDSRSIISRSTYAYYHGKTVMITGCGSIGSELCRQVAKCGPREMILFDIYENNAYEIEQELRREYPIDKPDGFSLHVEIGSVRDRARIREVMQKYKPQIVFHTAAHKHVPLMEHSSAEAVKNNVFGTCNVADAAEAAGVEKFILISTDKAVNPTNIMGATKRMCEMILQCRRNSKTSFAAVRFGNVLGSNGSVIPLFKKQIERGGPVTLTDKRIIRYFMTIPEASQLVMTAGAMAKSGELFVLDMGNPVKILDLAENMIRLSGLRPYQDIDIVEIGLRPGEKLYEELLIKTEELDKTDNKLIYIERDTPPSREAVAEKLAILKKAVAEAGDDDESAAIRNALMRVVPTFHDPHEVNNRHSAEIEMQITTLSNGAAVH